MTVSNKKKVEVSKRQRLDGIKEILRKSGKLEASILKERLTAHLGMDPTKYSKQRLSSDLITLRDENTIAEDESDYPKKWYLVGKKVEVVGENYLSNLGGKIIVSPLLSNEIRITPDISKLNTQDNYNFFFEVSDHFLCLSIRKEGLPAKVIFARTTSDNNTEEIVQSEFGKRYLIIQVPVSKVSSVKSSDKPGHLLIDFKDGHIFNVTDLESSVGSKVSSIELEIAQKMVQQGAITGKKTITEAWSSIYSEAINLKPMDANENVAVTAPLYLELGTQFSILLI